MLYQTYLVYAHIIFYFVLTICDVQVNMDGLGTLIGSTTHTWITKKTIYQYLGIRYGRSTGGRRRYKAPELETLEPYETHDLRKYKPPCPQLDYIRKNQDTEYRFKDIEDCLHLCVYTKNMSATRPVLFFVYGESFERGGAYQYPPNYLLEKDIVLVVPDYRLGPLGFLSTQTEDIPGNAGLLDVIGALQWTHKYIHLFGGNSSQITLFGHGSGAAMVSALLFSPHVSQNLFNGVIISSGSMFSPIAFDMYPLKSAKEIASCRCPLLDLRNMNSCLRDLNVKMLLECYENHVIEGKLTKDLTSFGGAKLTLSSIIPVIPHDLVKQKGAIKNVPLMIGSTESDGSYIYAIVLKWLEYNLGPNFREMNIFYHLRAIIEYLGVKDYSGTAAAFFMNTIFKNDQMESGNFSDMAKGLVDLASDIEIKGPVFNVAQAHAQYYSNKTYLYAYDFIRSFPYRHDMAHFGNFRGVHHFADIIHLFPHTDFLKHMTLEDKRMIIIMVELWGSFTKKGRPRSFLLNKRWPPMNKTVGKYMQIRRDGEKKDDYLKYELNVVNERHRRNRTNLHDKIANSTENKLGIVFEYGSDYDTNLNAIIDTNNLTATTEMTTGITTKFNMTSNSSDSIAGTTENSMFGTTLTMNTTSKDEPNRDTTFANMTKNSTNVTTEMTTTLTGNTNKHTTPTNMTIDNTKVSTTTEMINTTSKDSSHKKTTLDDMTKDNTTLSTTTEMTIRNSTTEMTKNPSKDKERPDKSSTANNITNDSTTEISTQTSSNSSSTEIPTTTTTLSDKAVEHEIVSEAPTTTTEYSFANVMEMVWSGFYRPVDTYIEPYRTTAATTTTVQTTTTEAPTTTTTVKTKTTPQASTTDTTTTSTTTTTTTTTTTQRPFQPLSFKGRRENYVSNQPLLSTEDLRPDETVVILYDNEWIPAPPSYEPPRPSNIDSFWPPIPPISSDPNLWLPRTKRK